MKKDSNNKDTNSSSNNKLFVFRRYKKKEGGKEKRVKHPKLIVDVQDKNYGFMGLTGASRRGHHSNIPLSKNPQTGKNDKSYLRQELRYDNKNNFEEILKDYNLSDSDKKAVIEFIKKRKKKK